MNARPAAAAAGLTNRQGCVIIKYLFETSN